MEQEAAKKLFATESHGAFFAVIGIVLPTETNFGLGDGDNPMVGDGDAMRITSQILQDVIWPAKGRLGINDPILLKQGAHEPAEILFVGQWQTLAIKGELFGAKSSSESCPELATKDAAEDFDGQEEIGA